MTREEIADLFARRDAAWRRLDSAALTADHADDCVVESPLAGGAITGREGIEQLHATYFHAFPDMVFQQEDLLIDGNRVMLVAAVSGTDRGGFMGLPPTGRPFNVRIVFLYTLRDGLIVHERRIYDFTSVLIQVGAIRAKPA